MRQVVWSKFASDQYLSALTFLSERNLAAAEHLGERIKATARELAKRPIGRPGVVDGTFEKIVTRTRYVLVYELMGDELHIHRLFHMSQDWHGWRDRADDS